MSEKQKYVSDYILAVMKNQNFFLLLYIAIVMSVSLSGIVHEQSAWIFLNQVKIVPIVAWKIPVIVVLLYSSCLLLMHMETEIGYRLFFRVFLEIIISFFICYIIGFSYNGIIFLILADTMRSFPKSKWKFPVAIGIALFYLLMDYSLVNVRFNILSMEVCAKYYQGDVESMLLMIKNLASSINTFLFLIYMIVLVRIQTSEKEEILQLNSKLNQANKELHHANVQLEEYAKETEILVQTRERNRLAREIHDTLGHALTGIITGVEACTVLIDVAPEETKKQLVAIEEVARRGIKDVRRSMKALRPDALERMELEEALKEIVLEMGNVTNTEIIFNCSAKLNHFNQDEENIIYRIVQESITNSIRHGKATRVEIDIHRKYNMLYVHIQDNGSGCKNVKKGFGLKHMEERLSFLKGELAYSGENGFTLDVQIPIRWGTEGEDD